MSALLGPSASGKSVTRITECPRLDRVLISVVRSLGDVAISSMS